VDSKINQHRSGETIMASMNQLKGFLPRDIARLETIQLKSTHKSASAKNTIKISFIASFLDLNPPTHPYWFIVLKFPGGAIFFCKSGKLFRKAGDKRGQMRMALFHERHSRVSFKDARCLARVSDLSSYLKSTE